MKLLTPQQEQEHYSNVLKGGWGGLLGGTTLATGLLWTAGRRFPSIRNLTPSFRAFLITGTGGFAAIIYADRYSRTYEATQNPDHPYTTTQSHLKKSLQASKPISQRSYEWALAHKPQIAMSTWAISLTIAFALINRNPLLSRAQKLVQARVYAQGLTVAGVVAAAGLAVEGEKVGGEERGEGKVKVLDEVERVRRAKYPGQNRWMDVVAASERSLREREEGEMVAQGW